MFFFFNDTATTEIYTLSLHDALPISVLQGDTCVLDKSSGSSIQPGYIAAGAAAIGAAIVGIIFAVRRGSSGTKRTKPARQDLEEYEEQYLRRQGQRPRRKPADTIGVVDRKSTRLNSSHW